MLNTLPNNFCQHFKTIFTLITIFVIVLSLKRIRPTGNNLSLMEKNYFANNFDEILCDDNQNVVYEHLLLLLKRLTYTRIFYI